MRMTVSSLPFQSREVAEVFASYPDKCRDRLLHLRRLVFDVAQETPGVGELVETLKWGVPAYLTVNPKSGTTIRLEGKRQGGSCGLYVHCQTDLIARCREIYPLIFVFEGNRGLIFDAGKEVPEAPLRHFIAMALTYHLKSVPNKSI